MPYRAKTDELNHSPSWFRDHCHAEDGGSPAFRQMLRNDMKLLEVEDDSTLTYAEKVGLYEEGWDQICANPSSGRMDLINQCLEAEALKGYSPHEQFKHPPYTKIAFLMKRYDLSPANVREYLAWKAKTESLKKARKKTARKVQRKIRAKARPATLDDFI
jgi:hypothetical protein